MPQLYYIIRSQSDPNWNIQSAHAVHLTVLERDIVNHRILTGYIPEDARFSYTFERDFKVIEWIMHFPDRHERMQRIFNREKGNKIGNLLGTNYFKMKIIVAIKNYHKKNYNIINYGDERYRIKD